MLNWKCAPHARFDGDVYLNILHSSTILPTSPFFGEKCSLPHFLKNKQNSNFHPFCRVGKIQLWLIKSTCFTYLLLILIHQYENTSEYNTGGYMLYKNRVGRLVGFLIFCHCSFSTVYKEHLKHWSKIYSNLNTQVMN